MDAVQNLVDKSLVRRARADRLDLLVTVQEYAAEKLGDGQQAAQTRHGAHFAHRAAATGLLSAGGKRSASWLEDLQVDIHNHQAACRHALSRGDAATASANLTACFAVMQARGPFHATRKLAQEAVAALEPGTSEAATASRILGRAASHLGEYDLAETALRQSLEVSRQLDARWREAGVCSDLSGVLRLVGRHDEARRYLQDAVAIHRELGDRQQLGGCLNNLANVDYSEGRFQSAREVYESALAVHRETKNRRFEAITLGNLGSADVELGHLESAEARFEQALELQRTLGYRTSEAFTLVNLGNLRRAQGRWDEALSDYEDALETTTAIGFRVMQFQARIELARLACETLDLQLATSHLEAAARLLEGTDEPDKRAILVSVQGRVACHRGDLERARALQERAEGLAAQSGPDWRLVRAMTEARARIEGE
jgi:tetratricopeptide (TPR) repeat protein